MTQRPPVSERDRATEPLPPSPPLQSPPQAQPLHPAQAGPRPIGTLMVIAILLLVTLAFWMMVLGVQQGRA